MTNDERLAELKSITAEQSRLAARRDELVVQLMLSKDVVPREWIASAAGLSVPRLYQIRDGRR